ncbi:MAG: TRAP transporter small permease subunit [Rhizobiales bacterium]|nr:TRAP transporter small permease subunit [Hyphomicrobiales bacterium]
MAREEITGANEDQFKRNNGEPGRTRPGHPFFEGMGMRAYSSQIIGVTAKIDRFTDAIGFWVAWLNVPLVLAVAYEVIARYFFHSPTIWVFDVTYMLYATIFMLGAAYALHKGAHIRTDFFFERWSKRTQGVIDSVAYVVFFFPSLILFLYVSWDEGWSAFLINETSEQTPWRPILWPFKMVVPLTCLLLMIQGVSETIKSFFAAMTGIELEHKEKVEI